MPEVTASETGPLPVPETRVSACCLSPHCCVPLSISPLGKNVWHSSYSEQHPWWLISRVHFTPWWSLAVKFHTSAVCLGSSLCFANRMESGKGSLPSARGKGRHLSPFCQPVGRLAEALGQCRGQVSSICLSPSWAVRKTLKQRFYFQPFGQTEANRVRRIGGVKSTVNGGVSGGEGCYLPGWSFPLGGRTSYTIHKQERATGDVVCSPLVLTRAVESRSPANLSS